MTENDGILHCPCCGTDWSPGPWSTGRSQPVVDLARPNDEPCPPCATRLDPALGITELLDGSLGAGMLPTHD